MAKTISKDLKKLQKYAKFCVKYLPSVGLIGWTVLISNDGNIDESLATVEADIYEKVLKIAITDDFEELDEERQKNVLFHELMHGSFLAYRKRVKEYELLMEEHYINDLVRGFEWHTRLEFDDDEKKA